MNVKKKLAAFLAMMMALVLAFSLSVTAFAAVEDTGFADVAADAWYYWSTAALIKRAAPIPPCAKWAMH